MGQLPTGIEEKEKKQIDYKMVSDYLVPFLLGVCLWVLPAPDGLDDRGWHMLIIFLATLVGVMLASVPMSAVTLVGVTAFCLTSTLTRSLTENRLPYCGASKLV